MENIVIESGCQLFARLNKRPCLNNINSVLLENGPLPSEYIEIAGTEDDGKMLLLMDFLARCLLPSTYKGIQVEGKNCGALILNTNHHFDLFKLIEIMEFMLRRSCDKFFRLTPLHVESVIKESLKNLTVLNCYNSAQFQTTLLNLEYILAENTNVSFVVIDSISSYYWEYRTENGILGLQAYHLKVLSDLHNSINSFNVIVLFTVNERDVKYLKQFYESNIVCKILLKKQSNRFQADILYKDKCKNVMFDIESIIKF